MSQRNENHLLEEELVNGYYDGLDPSAKLHLDHCPECAHLYRTIRETLDALNEARVPDRTLAYGAEVWARLLPHLPFQPAEPSRSFRWFYTAAAVALLAVAFVAGMFTERTRIEIPKLAKIPIPQQVKYSPPAPSAEISHNTTPKHHAVHPRVAVTKTPQDQDGKLLELSASMDNNPDAALPTVLNIIHASPSDKTKEHALFVLAQSDSPRASQALLDLARQPANPELQVAAVRMIGMVRGDQGRRELAGLYTSSSNPALKHEILTGLMLTGSKSTPTGGQDELSELYKAGASRAEKKQILDSVFLMGDAATLLDVLKNEKDPALRVAAVNSLGALDGNSTVLTNLYQTETNTEVCHAIVEALAARHNAEALAALARNEKDPAAKAFILEKISAHRK